MFLVVIEGFRGGTNIHGSAGMSARTIRKAMLESGRFACVVQAVNGGQSAFLETGFPETPAGGESRRCH